MVLEYRTCFGYLYPSIGSAFPLLPLLFLITYYDNSPPPLLDRACFELNDHFSPYSTLSQLVRRVHNVHSEEGGVNELIEIEDHLIVVLSN